MNGTRLLGDEDQTYSKLERSLKSRSERGVGRVGVLEHGVEAGEHRLERFSGLDDIDEEIGRSRQEDVFEIRDDEHRRLGGFSRLRESRDGTRKRKFVSI
jgi:hypothetical protein